MTLRKLIENLARIEELKALRETDYWNPQNEWELNYLLNLELNEVTIETE